MFVGALEPPEQEDLNFAINFDLFSDDFELVEATNVTGSSENIPEDIATLTDSIKYAEQSKNQID